MLIYINMLSFEKNYTPIILIFIVLSFFILGNELVDEDLVNSNIEKFDSSLSKKLDNLPKKTVSLIQDYDNHVNTLKQIDDKFLRKLTYGSVGEDMQEEEDSFNYNEYSRCRIVPFKSNIVNSINIKGVNSGEDVTIDKCFSACNNDYNCKQAIHRLSNKGSACFPMSEINITNIKLSDDDKEYETLVCDKMARKKHTPVLKSMKKEYKKYIKHRKMQEQYLSDMIKDINYNIKNVVKHDLIDVYAEDAKKIENSIDGLQKDTDEKYNNYMDKTLDDKILEKKVKETKYNLESFYSDMWFWLFLLIISCSITGFLVIR